MNTIRRTYHSRWLTRHSPFLIAGRLLKRRIRFSSERVGFFIRSCIQSRQSIWLNTKMVLSIGGYRAMRIKCLQRSTSWAKDSAPSPST